MTVLAVDQGTTSTKALTLSADGAMTPVKQIAHEQRYPQLGWVEHDPETLLTHIEDCVAAAGPVDAIALTNQGESCLAWDARTKTPLSPVIVWQDARTQDAIARLTADGAEAETLARAGLPLDPYFSASKLAWLLAHNDDVKAAAKAGRLRLGTTDAFFIDRLTGRWATDVATASRTSLLNLDSLAWDETLCALFGVPIELLPPIIDCAGPFADVTAARAPLAARIVDQQAALYGHGCRAAGDAKITFGTGAFALAVAGVDRPTGMAAGLLPTVAWRKAGEAAVYAVDGGVYSAGAALEWLDRLGFAITRDQLGQLAGEAAIDRGLAFVPALAGLACPHWDRSARGAWLGLSLDARAEDLAKAVLEGVAFRTAEVIDAMASAVAPDAPVSIDGGMSNNPYFVQFLADLLQRPVRPAPAHELTALGAAALAAEAIGWAAPPAALGETTPPRLNRLAARGRFADAVAAVCQFAP